MPQVWQSRSAMRAFRDLGGRRLASWALARRPPSAKKRGSRGEVRIARIWRGGKAVLNPAGRAAAAKRGGVDPGGGLTSEPPARNLPVPSDGEILPEAPPVTTEAPRIPVEPSAEVGNDP
jgi:hypothetical protein